MSIPKKPRPQMITLMYLFLTAMLALNVSRQVLNAFVKVEQGIQSTISAIESKNTLTMKAFQKQMDVNKEKTKPYYMKAQRTIDLTNQLYDEIEKYKQDIIKLAGGLKANKQGDSVVASKKSVDYPSQVMLFEGKGDKLQKSINRTRDSLLAIVEQVGGKGARDRFEKRITLSANDPKNDPQNRNWAEYNFQMIPTVASITLLTKLQNDVKNAKADIINYLLNQIGAADIKVDRMQAKIIENTNFVMKGQKYKAEIFASAWSSTQEPYVFIGDLDTSIAGQDTLGNFQKITEDMLKNYSGKSELVTSSEHSDEKQLTPLSNIDTVLPPQQGMGKYNIKPQGIGMKHYEGAIRIRKPTGEYEWYPFREEYQVAQGAVVVSPEKMNVLYIGVDNPIAVSVAGFQSEDVQPRLQGVSGRLDPRGEGKYYAKIGNARPGDAKISVSVKMKNGKTRHMGSQKFRIKRVPDPIATVGGKFKGGKVPASSFTAQQGVIAKLEDFVYDLRFEVVSFSMTYIPQRGDALVVDTRRPTFNSRMKQFLNQAKPGDRFFIDQVKVRGPSGETRELPSISFELT